MPRSPRYRRSPSLIFYWDAGRLVAHNYRSHRRMVVDPAMVPFLDAFDREGAPPRTVAALAGHTLLEQDTGESTSDATGWTAWGPLALAFHFGTKDVRFTLDPRGRERIRAARSKQSPAPAPVKRAPRRARPMELPDVSLDGEFVQTLLARRTWREFSRRKTSLHDIATLLRLTWGVQRSGVASDRARIVLKTSPSAGACHPGEVYLLAIRVDGLRAGLYHYESDRHRLVLIRQSATARDIARYLPGQPWYRRAPALFLMTAVFEREQWRYPTPRAYRAVLLDAGHLCQTFCLTASWLKLAPFCSMALADSAIERDLGIDGISEGVLYAAGVGCRPPGGWRPGVPGLERR